MQSEKLTFALIQSKLHWEDKELNLAMFEQKITALTSPCDVIILPEMFSTGFTMNAIELGEDMFGPTLAWLKKNSMASNAVVCGSFIAKDADCYYNRFVWMRPDGTYEFYDKKHLFRMANEDDYFSAGNKRIVVEIKGWKINPLICYDLRFPVWVRNKHEIVDGKAIPEFDVQIYVANWPAVRSLPWDILLRSRAVENQVYCIGVNRVGEDGNGKSYNGHSAVIGPKGDYLLEPVDKQEGAFIVELDAKKLNAFREKFPQGLDSDRFELT